MQFNTNEQSLTIEGNSSEVAEAKTEEAPQSEDKLSSLDDPGIIQLDNLSNISERDAQNRSKISMYAKFFKQRNKLRVTIFRLVIGWTWEEIITEGLNGLNIDDETNIAISWVISFLIILICSTLQCNLDLDEVANSRERENEMNGARRH